MPELPEVETIVRTLRPHVEGQRILKADFYTSRVRKGTVPDPAGRLVRRVTRYGKQILLELDEGLLAAEPRMTGLLLWGKEPGPYTRARFLFPRGVLSFDDIRQFGSIRWLVQPPDHLGPDPLEISAAEFRAMLKRRHAQLKRLLLDQHFLRGIGNIYADETLFRARIHPATPASTLGGARAERLYRSMMAVLNLAIEMGGSTISDYVDAEGRPGRFQQFHQVYGKTGQPCPVCHTPIRRMVLAQRGTHYCLSCQRR